MKEGVTREVFKAALKDGSVAQLLHPVAAKPGDVYFIPSGTIHALCTGVRIAEIQQNSDTTYRVFDWNRVGLDGKPRDLHIDHALAVSDFSATGPDRCEPTRLPRENCCHERFVNCEKFCFERLSNFQDVPVELTTRGKCFHILTVVSGEIEVTAGGESLTRRKWDSALIPAGAGQYSLQAGPEATVLLFYRPVE